MDKYETWWANSDSATIDRVAEDAGTSRRYLYQICHRYRRPSPELADRIEAASGGELNANDLLRRKRRQGKDAAAV